MRASEWLAEMDYHTGSAVETLRVSSHGYVSHPADVPAHTVYDHRIDSIGPFGVHLFGQGRTMGVVSVEGVYLSLINIDDALSALIDHGFDGRAATLRRLVDPRGSLVASEIVLRGTMEGMDSDSGMMSLRFKIYDRRRDIDKPIQKNFLPGTVLGTSASIDGTPDQKDKPRPLCFGKCFSVPGILVNPYDLMIQVHDGRVASIVAYDGGIPLGFAGDYPTIAALRAAVHNPGKYATCLAAGVWRPYGSFKGRPGFVWTADVVEGATAADRRAGAVTKRLLARLGQDGDIDAASFAALDASATAEVGIYIEDETSGLTAIGQVLGSVGGWIAPTPMGAFQVGRFIGPGAPTWTLTEPDILTASVTETVAFTPNPDTDGGVPTHRVVIKGRRNWHVHNDSDIAGCIASKKPALATALRQEYVDAKAEDPAVLVKHLLSRELTIETLIADTAAAEAEASRRLGLYGVQRKVIRVMATRDEAQAMRLNTTGTVQFRGLGFDAGKPMVVIGREEDFQRERVILTLWG